MATTARSATLTPTYGERMLDAYIASQPPRITAGKKLKIPNDFQLSRLVDGKPNQFSPAAELTKGRVALFFMPRAFTPTCSNQHLPAVVEAYPEFRKRDIKVFVMSPDNRDVMSAWFRAHDEKGIKKGAVALLTDNCTENKCSDTAPLQQAKELLKAPSAFMIEQIPDYLGDLGRLLGIATKKCEDRHLGLVFPRGVALLHKGLVLDARFEQDPGKCETSHPSKLLDDYERIYKQAQEMHWIE
ncbi:MAG: redoxin family protein [Verrucomicrobiota bacterium]|nr:redoxin family protein [Verrucomicrobiota bacterium]